MLRPNMKLSWAANVALLFGCFVAGAQPIPVYENRASVTDPQIDATAFVNRGQFNITATDQPYDTQNTLYYTNFAGAAITGSGGFLFDFVGTNGLRSPSSSWLNNGSITFATAGSGGFSGGGSSGTTAGSFFSTSPTSWVLVDATNILNRGGVTVDVNGLIRLRGSAVNLSRSGLRAGVDPLAPITPGTSQGLIYSNEIGITENYWGVGQNNALDPAAVGPYDLAALTGKPVQSSIFEALDASSLTNFVNLPPLQRPATNVFAVTNAVSATNWVIQAVFINTNSPDPQFKIDVKFGSARDVTVPGSKMPIVQFSFEDIDTITAEPYTNFLYVLDTLGGITNSFLQTNRSTRVDQKPSNFTLTRVTPKEWAKAVTNNVTYKPDLLYNSTYASQTVTNWYSGYSANIGQGVVSAGFGRFGSTKIAAFSHPTNKAGRIEVEADRLDVSLTRFRSEGLLSLKAKELVGTPYKLDAAVVSLDVGSTNGSLTVSNLIQPIVRRFNGVINLYSAVWTNQTFVAVPDPATPGSMITNTIDIRCHALIVDHQFITRVPVQTYRFAATTPGLVLLDAISAVETFTVDSPDIVLRAPVNTLSNPITAETFPSVTNLVVRSSLMSQYDVHLGSPIRPITNFVSSGFVSGSTVDMDVSSFSNFGQVQTTVGDLTLNALTNVLHGGQLISRASLFINADEFTFTNSTLQAGYEAKNPNTGNTNYSAGQLRLNVVTKLSDLGSTASNSITVYDGFHLLRKPVSGDLLGSTITSKVSRFAEAVHTWAGADLGAVPAGYSNNAALGTLLLDGRELSLFTFASATGSPAALYVNHLVLANFASNVTSSLNIAPDFTLYFADSNIPADQLDGLFGGRVKWVKSYVGAGSAAAVTLSTGRVVLMNRALVASTVEDSDNDGMPNALDPYPFEPASLRIGVRVVDSPLHGAEISWAGTPGSRYRVEVASSLESQDWQLLSNVENSAESPGSVSVLDASETSEQPRFYRVVQDR